jgi:GR25 family glycosyltransferase involved in LPS biosynthesis
MYSLGGMKINNIICINLPFREDRKQAIINQSKEKRFPLTFYQAKYNESDPERGRFSSHLNVIKNAKKKGCRSILILEDDAKIWSKSLNVVTPPDNWKMLYLGGNVQKVFTDDDSMTSDVWKRVTCLTTHAYIIRYSMYNVILEKAKEYIGKIPLDEFYCKHIHPNYATYMVTPEHITQEQGYSDIKKKNVTYNQILTKTLTDPSASDSGAPDATSFDTVDTELHTNPDTNETSCIMKGIPLSEAELPFVTLITPTCNRPGMADFLIWSFYKQNYPGDKLQWIIADDGDLANKIRKYIPSDDKRIKYINCKMNAQQYLPMSRKLNLCNSYIEDKCINGVTQPQVILHFFDFVYHHPESTLSRVKALMYNKEKQCIGCTDFGVFDFDKNRSYISYFPDVDDNKNIMCLQSLGYWKSFWEERNFDETKLTLPSYFYLINRISKAITMPYEFSMITLHGNGLKIDEKKKDKNTKEDTIYQKNSFNFYDNWDRDTQEFMLLLKETLN